jgi:RNA polymerase sigma-70 factor (ECF subfamily)
MWEQLTDEDLMARYLHGEIRAFETLLQRHRRGVYHFIYRLTGSEDLAQDLLQDVFVRLVHSASSFERRSRFTTWLYTIARNLCIDHLRKKRHRQATSLDEPLPGSDGEMNLLQQIRASDPPPERQAHDRAVRERLLRAIASLNPDQREVFLLREEAGLPFEEIAEMVGAPLNTVKSRMRYALQNLRSQLVAQGLEPWLDSTG